MSSSPGNIFWSHLCCENNTPNLIKFCSRKIDKMQQKMDNGNNMSACSRMHCLCLGWWWKLKLIFSIEPRFTFEWCRLLCVPSAAAEARLIIWGQFLRMCLFVYLRIYLTRMNIGAVCLCPGHHHWSPPDLDTPPLTSSQTSATHRHSHIQYSSICKPAISISC